MSFFYRNFCNPKWFAIVGVALTVVGAWFVAYEVVNQYRGRAYGGITMDNADGNVKKLPDLEKWESAKKGWMWTGLILITFGGVLQIASEWIRGRRPSALETLPTPPTRIRTEQQGSANGTPAGGQKMLPEAELKPAALHGHGTIASVASIETPVSEPVQDGPKAGSVCGPDSSGTMHAPGKEDGPTSATASSRTANAYAGR